MRKVTPFAVAVALAIGCNRPAPGPQIPAADVSYQGYHFVLEAPESKEFKTEGQRRDDGRGHVTEDITVTCGTKVVRIVDGKLTLNGADRGAVKPGDTIKVDAAARVWVNQQPRGE